MVATVGLPSYWLGARYIFVKLQAWTNCQL